MNVIKLMGGLGNQIFQYAFGQVQKFNGIDVFYDRSWFDNRLNSETPRSYLLDKFHTDVNVSLFLKNQETITEAGYNKELATLQDFNFWGYWQYLRYYDCILSLLQAEFLVKGIYYTAKYEALRKQAENSEITALHVRRGDYVTTKGFKTLPLTYYFEALQLVPGDIFIFSDDILWCKEKFKTQYFNRKLTFVELSDYLSFDLMRHCSNFVISNSTFSTLAAYLCTNSDKIVVGSKNVCLESAIEKEKKRYQPKNWILI